MYVNMSSLFLFFFYSNTIINALPIQNKIAFMAGSAGLVPGDLVNITGRVTIPCDMVLISGSCEVDESTITGDTVPATKVAYQVNAQQTFGERIPVAGENKLVGGSKVLAVKPAAANEFVTAVVVRTGFNSMKGKIIRSVLLAHLQTKEHPYIKDVDNYSWIMFFCGVLSQFMSAIYFCAVPENIDTKMSIRHFTDVILISLPAFLPLLYSWPLLIARMRLKRAGIQAINVLGLLKFGALDCICYDKTGTLTEDTLGLYGVLEVADKSKSYVKEKKNMLMFYK